MSLYKGTELLAGVATNTISNAHSLFDFKWTDHKLNEMSWLRADTFSWQSGAVYVAAYNELVAEYSNASNINEIERYKSNITKVGDFIENDYVISGFDTNKYAMLPDWISFTTLTALVKFRVTDFGTAGNVFGPYYNNTGLELAYETNNKITFRVGNGSSWIVNSTSTLTISANIDYYARIKYEGGYYSVEISNDNETWTTYISVASSQLPQGNLLLGQGFVGSGTTQYFLRGSIDLKESYIKLDGEYWWEGCKYVSYKRTPKGYKIVDNTQTEAVSDEYNSVGVSWFYVLDTTNQRFKLPRTKFGFIGLRDVVGKYTEAGLPNITGAAGIGMWNTGKSTSTYNHGLNWIDMQGSLHITESTDTISNWTETTSANKTSWTAKASRFAIDASKSSEIYGNSNTVQPPATQMYLYFYVGEYSQSQAEQVATLDVQMFLNKADVDLGNLSASGQALFTAKLDADKIQQVSTLPVSPVAGTLYLIPE